MNKRLNMVSKPYLYIENTKDFPIIYLYNTSTYPSHPGLNIIRSIHCFTKGFGGWFGSGWCGGEGTICLGLSELDLLYSLEYDYGLFHNMFHISLTVLQGV